MCALAACALILGACTRQPEWHSTDISGIMPELAFTLRSEQDHAVTEADYAGKVNLLYFGYTSCPDVCPATLARLKAALGRLTPGQRNQVRVLFVSVDPKRDDPTRLRQYTDAFGPEFIGLTGTTEQLEALTKRYRTTYSYGKPDAAGFYEVSHASAVYAFDKSGRARLLIRNSDDSKAIAADIARLTEQD